MRLGGNAQSVGRSAVEAAKVAAGGGGDERERRQHEGDHITKGAFGILFIFYKKKKCFGCWGNHFALIKSKLNLAR